MIYTTWLIFSEVVYFQVSYSIIGNVRQLATLRKKRDFLGKIPFTNENPEYNLLGPSVYQQCFNCYFFLKKNFIYSAAIKDKRQNFFLVQNSVYTIQMANDSILPLFYYNVCFITHCMLIF